MRGRVHLRSQRAHRWHLRLPRLPPSLLAPASSSSTTAHPVALAREPGESHVIPSPALHIQSEGSWFSPWRAARGRSLRPHLGHASRLPAHPPPGRQLTRSPPVVRTLIFFKCETAFAHVE